MSTELELVFPVGTVLRRTSPLGDEGDAVKVVSAGDELIVTPHEVFGPPYTLDITDARMNYVADTSMPEAVHPVEVPLESTMSPEQFFAVEAAKREADPAPKRPKTKEKPVSTAQVKAEGGIEPEQKKKT